ncbi:MAG TPA: hypothetical protein VGZ52_04990 [Acidimicrobiales bacterium]|nr:hypothetical protein [Acidimicrobiales bacterium]
MTATTSSAAVPSSDRVTALYLAVAAVSIGSFLPWAQQLGHTVRGTDGLGNLTLLLGGIVGALILRWRIGGGTRRALLTASFGLCGAASLVLLGAVARVTLHAGAQPMGGLFVAATGAVFATALTGLLRHTA